ncbi:MAG: glycine betaine ABC transporter substrate-binding protein, partial [Pseudomonadota bacterium]
MRQTLTLLATAATLALAGGMASAQSKVMVGEPSWPGAKIMANVIGQVIESRLGGEVGYAPGANAVIFAAMDGGRGDIGVDVDVAAPAVHGGKDHRVGARRIANLAAQAALDHLADDIGHDLGAG